MAASADVIAGSRNGTAAENKSAPKARDLGIQGASYAAASDNQLLLFGSDTRDFSDAYRSDPNAFEPCGERFVVRPLCLYPGVRCSAHACHVDCVHPNAEKRASYLGGDAVPDLLYKTGTPMVSTSFGSFLPAAKVGIATGCSASCKGLRCR